MYEEISQIQKDVKRTFPSDEKIPEKAYTALEHVLIIFVKYNARVGYVQGMNFLARAFLHHGAEVIAFWILVQLVEEYELESVYLPGNILFIYRIPRII